MTIHLSTEEKQKLEVLHQKEENINIRDRIRAVLLRDEQWPNKQIAQAFRTDEFTIASYLNSYDTHKNFSLEKRTKEEKEGGITKQLSFTKDALLKIETPTTGRRFYKDTKERGLILVAFPSGSKVFYLYKKIDGKPYQIRIAPFPDFSVQEAREKAIELKNQIAKGINPAKVKASLKDELNFKQLFDKYIDDYAKHHKKSWKKDITIMERYGKPLYDKKISTIGKKDIQKLFNDITVNVSKVSANRVRACLSTVFNKAIEWELLEKNYTFGIKKHKEQARDRYLTIEEKDKFLRTLAEEKNHKLRDFILISLFTAARKSNVLSMRWENISFDNRTWYIPDTKNGDPQLLPLIDPVIEILNRRKEQATTEWVFPSVNSKTGHLQEPKKVWARVLAKAKIKDLRIHDLRRTLGSWMAHSGASEYIIGKALNHKSPSSTAIYARLGIDPVRGFMNKAKEMLIRDRESTIKLMSS